MYWNKTTLCVNTVCVILVTFLITIIKYLTEASILREEGFILAQGFRNSGPTS
jgi:hypothetical protein